jgi:hypothetical protein
MLPRSALVARAGQPPRLALLDLPSPRNGNRRDGGPDVTRAVPHPVGTRCRLRTYPQTLLPTWTPSTCRKWQSGCARTPDSQDVWRRASTSGRPPQPQLIRQLTTSHLAAALATPRPWQRITDPDRARRYFETSARRLLTAARGDPSPWSSARSGWPSAGLPPANARSQTAPRWPRSTPSYGRTSSGKRAASAQNSRSSGPEIDVGDQRIGLHGVRRREYVELGPPYCIINCACDSRR